MKNGAERILFSSFIKAILTQRSSFYFLCVSDDLTRRDSSTRPQGFHLSVPPIPSTRRFIVSVERKPLQTSLRSMAAGASANRLPAEVVCCDIISVVCVCKCAVSISVVRAGRTQQYWGAGQSCGSLNMLNKLNVKLTFHTKTHSITQMSNTHTYAPFTQHYLP